MKLPRQVRRQKWRDRILPEMGKSASAFSTWEFKSKAINGLSNLVNSKFKSYCGCSASSDADKIITSAGFRNWKESLWIWTCEWRHYNNRQQIFSLDVTNISCRYELKYGGFTIARGGFNINTVGSGRIKNSYSRTLLYK